MASIVMPMMASWADSTIDASWEVAARTCLRLLMIERARNTVKERTYSWLLYTELDTVDHSKTWSAKKGTPLKEGALGILRVIPMQLIIESAQSAPGLRRNHFFPVQLRCCQVEPN